MADACECGNELSDSIKIAGNFLTSCKTDTFKAYWSRDAPPV